MVAGRNNLYICSQCVEKCAEIFDRDTDVASPDGGWHGRWPLKEAPTEHD
jgi:ClpX C4-type zinc finger